MMTLDELAGALQAIRKDFGSTPVLCIPWLHLKHPIHPVQEMLLRGGSAVPVETRPEPANGAIRMARAAERSSLWIARAALCLANAVRLVYKLSRLRWTIDKAVSELSGRTFAVVAKSWCFGPNPAPATADDFYYGDLQRRLAARGVSMLLLCGDANNTGWQTFAAGCLSTEANCRIPELALCPRLTPLKVAADQIGASLSLRLRSRSLSESLLKRAMRIASLDCLNPAVTQDSLYFEIARAAVRLWKPQAFMTLYEGHGWEKVAWHGAKTGSHSCRTVGYQHTALFSEALSMIRPYVDNQERSVPDIVLSLGEHTGAILDAGHRQYGTQTVQFGTFRRQAAGMASAPAPASLRTVLVLPEGIASEADALFRFAYECGIAMPGYRFILRGHPQWPASRALKLIDLPIRSRGNMEISEKISIQEDFDRSSVLLYRGSSAALYGILSGLLAVNLQLPEMVNSDPLYQLANWRRTCGTLAGFQEILQEFERQPAEGLAREWSSAADYVNRYIAPVDDRSVASFLDAAVIRRTDLCTA